MNTDTRPPIRPAATIVLLRDGANGPEVFMLRRTQAAAFLGGAYVFPGGAIDAQDRDPRLPDRMRGITAGEANALLHLAGQALAYWSGAIRECFEESGILLVRGHGGEPLDAQRRDAFLTRRQAMCAGEVSFTDVLLDTDCTLPAGEIVYFDHWITPAGRSRRFDTRFFMARGPRDQEGSHDDSETVSSAWLRPAHALQRSAAGEIELPFATYTILSVLASFATVDEALAAARATRDIEVNRPVVAQGAKGPKIVRRGDDAYAEIHWSDPQETTTTTYDMTPGVVKRLDRHVRRLIAPNPGIMTGPGTNTYLVGDSEVAVIDPGPAMPEHIDAILANAGRIRWILCTHTHRDHSPGAALLRERTGAQVIGRPAPAGGTQDVAFRPDHVPRDGETLQVAGVSLRALHTPGHASNHVCYLLEQTRMLFTGDHVMQGSTVIINPPDGDMIAYLASLDRVRALDPAIIAPGHGYLIAPPAREIERLVAHRLNRERKVVDALSRAPDTTVDDLLPLVYADVPEQRHRAAARSLLAHLIKLEREHRVTLTGERYRLA